MTIGTLILCMMFMLSLLSYQHKVKPLPTQRHIPFDRKRDYLILVISILIMVTFGAVLVKFTPLIMKSGFWNYKLW